MTPEKPLFKYTNCVGGYEQIDWNGNISISTKLHVINNKWWSLFEINAFKLFVMRLGKYEKLKCVWINHWQCFFISFNSLTSDYQWLIKIYKQNFSRIIYSSFDEVFLCKQLFSRELPRSVINSLNFNFNSIFCSIYLFSLFFQI
jgi:hypothetical protein